MYTFVHELGHCLGMNHNKSSTPDGSVMQPVVARGTDFTSLGAQDIEVLKYLYP